MHLVVLLERTPEGWRAWVPALPGCEATGVTEADAEAALRVRARERIVAMKTPAERAHVARLKAIELAIRVRRPDVTPPLPDLDAEARAALISHIDALMNSRRLPRDLLNAIFAFRRDLVDLGEPLDEDQPDNEQDLDPHGFGMTLSIADEMPAITPRGRVTRLRLVTRDGDGTARDAGVIDIPEEE